MMEKIYIPKVGQVEEKIRVGKVYVKHGMEVKKGEILFDFESDKASMSIEAPINGFVSDIQIREGGDIDSGALALIISSTGGNFEREITKNIQEEKDDFWNGIRFPKDKKNDEYPKEQTNNINYSNNKFEPYSEENSTLDNDKESSSKHNKDFRNGDCHLYKANKRIPDYRKAIANKLHQSTLETASVTLIRKIEANELIKCKNELGERFSSFPLEISLDILIAITVAETIKQKKHFNARFDVKGLQTFEKINIGIAMDFGNGLFVPVIGDFLSKDFLDLIKEFNEIKQKIKGKKIHQLIMPDGTFTITNLGGYGIESFNPIINIPEIAILGIGVIFTSLIRTNNGFIENYYFKGCLTFDHRFIDGVDAARFLNELSNNIRNLKSILVSKNAY